MNFLNNLNPPQKKAVEHGDGPLLILAGAGSGKTRVITYRIANLICNRGVSPSNILAVTFTNKAAEEMKERIAGVSVAVCRGTQSGSGSQMTGLWIGTFHSICLRLLRRHGSILGFRSDFYIYDKSDQMDLVRECVRELNINDEIYPVNSLSSRVSHLKNRLITPDEFSKTSKGFGMDDKALKVYRLYQEKLISRHAMDFDDLIMKCVELLETNEEICRKYQDEFRYVLVDEYQDTNAAQYRLIRRLTDKYQNLCVVGDDDQSIYRFRGAELQNILSFETDFPSATIIRLEQNYRSTASILDIAGKVIERNAGRHLKKLWTENEEGEPVDYRRTDDEREEAKYVARCIRSMIQNGRKGRDCAILYRTNAQSRILEEMMIESGIPYIIVGGLKFYERKEIRDIMAYVKASLHPEDDITLRRIINVPHRGIGAVTLRSVEEHAVTCSSSIYDGVLKLSAGNPRLKVFSDIIERLRILVRELPPSEFVKSLFEISGYLDALKKDERGEDRIENIMELLAAVKRYEERMPGMDICGFLDEASLFSSADDPELRSSDNVALMTLHSAKGLEFPVVFITGLEEGMLPHAGSMDNMEAIEEERRLCYVGITRAKEKLYITSARKRNIFGQLMDRTESRFIRDIRGNTKIRIEIDSPPMYNKPVYRDSTNNHRVSWDKGRFKAGDRVSHQLWGVGVVEKSEGRGEEEKVVVKFTSVGSKQLAVRLANLTSL